MKTLAIDIGQVSTRAAFVLDGKPEPLIDREHPEASALLPSRILLQDADCTTGWAAASNKDSFSVRRFFETENSQSNFCLETFFKNLKTRAEKMSGSNFGRALFLWPSSVSVSKQDSIAQALKVSGFEAVSFLNDFYAAPITFWSQKSKRGTYLVYHWSASHFLASVVKMEGENIEILSAAQAETGGIEIENLVAKNLFAEIIDQHPQVAEDEVFLARVREDVARAKTALSHRGSYDFKYIDQTKAIQFVRAFSRFELTQWVSGFIEETIDVCNQAFKGAALKKENISEILLSGGVSRMPAVHQRLELEFLKKPALEINPDQTRILGAAVYAGFLDSGTADLHLSGPSKSL